MGRKVWVEVKVRLSLEVDEGVEVASVMEEMGHEFTSSTSAASVVDSEILSHEITDSK
jgi:hypothetical protein